jgi:hypothetical protein
MRSMRRSGTFLTSLLLMSSSFRVMFLDRPSRASCNAASTPGRPMPPQKTRVSGIRVSPLAEFGAELLERDMRKFAGFVWADLLFLLKRLAVPSA